jgi:hypothetical protein
MDVEILYDGNSVTSEVISYERDKGICTGVGIVRVVFKREVSFTPTLYKKIVIYEGGRKKGTYYIHTIDKELPSNFLVLSCQDASIKLQNYFIAENYFIDYPSSSDYWIKKFLAEATVSYQFDGVSAGTLLSNDTSLGMSTCMDVMVTLCQMNGWYFYFDEENICHIGKLHVDTGNASSTVDDTQILNFSTNTNDRLFRNRVLVWGNGDPTSNKWVFADLDWHGQYENEYGPNDIRTVVIANSNIRNVGTANSAASLALKEFSKTTFEVAVELVGVYSFDLGDYIAVNSNFLQTTGIITTISSSMSSGGLYTRVILNQRCPRLFSFFDYGGYVYVGTQGAGVWRKPLEFSNTWLNFSEGLTDLNIIDLAVDRGVYACVSDKGNLFVRSDATIWQKYSPSLTDHLTEVDGEFITTTYPAASGICNAVTIDKTTGEVIAPFSLKVTNSGDPSRSWIYYLQGMNGTNYQYVDDDDIPGYTIIDIDNNGAHNIVSTRCTYSGNQWVWNDSWGQHNLDQYNSDLPLQSGWSVNYHGTLSFTQYSQPLTNNFLADARVGLFTGDIGTSLGDYGVAISNACTLIPRYEDSTLFFDEEDIYADTVTPRFSLYNADLLGTAYQIVNGDRQIYVITTSWSDWSTTVTLHIFDPDSGFLYNAGSRDLPGYAYTWIPKGSVSGGFVSWLVGSSGEDGSETVCAFFYEIETEQIHVRTLPLADAQFLYPIGMTAVDRFLYYTINVETDFDEYIDIAGCVGPFVGDVNTTRLLGGTNRTTFAGNGEMAVLVDHPYNSPVQLIDYDSNQVIYTLDNPYTNEHREGLVFARQLTKEGNFIYYDPSDGSIISLPLTSGVGCTYDIGVYPAYPYWPNSIAERMMPEDSCLSLIYDQLYLEVRTYQIGDFGFIYTRNGAELTPSGERMMGDLLHSQFIKDRKQIQTGYRDIPYQTSMYTPTPYRVESSIMSPVAVFGGTAYSGITFTGQTTTGETVSGIQTGWNQSKLFVSPYGQANTFTDLVMNGLQSYVNDVRSFNATVPVVESGVVMSGTKLANIVMFTQPSSTVIASGIESYLHILDVSNIPDFGSGGAIVVSGLIGQSTIEAVFSGYANHIETTHTQAVPYMFVSISGVPPRFYQKDYYDEGDPATFFADVTNNLPNFEINCIRCDDQV